MIRLSFQALGPGPRWGGRSQTVQVWRMDADRGGARPDATLPVVTIRPAVQACGPEDWLPASRDAEGPGQPGDKGRMLGRRQPALQRLALRGAVAAEECRRVEPEAREGHRAKE